MVFLRDPEMIFEPARNETDVCIERRQYPEGGVPAVIICSCRDRIGKISVLETGISGIREFFRKGSGVVFVIYRDYGRLDESIHECSFVHIHLRSVADGDVGTELQPSVRSVVSFQPTPGFAVTNALLWKQKHSVPTAGCTAIKQI